ncbi:MAG: Ldh family oxidoreductase [Gammaproteobacteria bacterium]|nr:Ldh family oxidoreductase [Gammaproteobacteria bacterium]
MLQLSAETIRDQLRLVFESWKMESHHIETCVLQMVEADLMGIDSHGIGMLPTYADNFSRGALVANPTVRTVNDLGAICLLDADHGMGHVAATQGMELAIEKASQHGLGAVSVRNSNHFGAAGVYSNMARKRGYIGICTTGTTQRSVVPTFGKEPRFSTNPIAFAAPGNTQPNGFSLDMATSTVAVGKLRIAARAEKPMPEGWVVNTSGDAETDPEAALAATPKRLTPLGGTRTLGSHKGYGLAVMVDILSSVLSGSFIGGYNLRTGEREKYINVGHFFLALDPRGFDDDDQPFEDRLDDLIDMLRATPAADPDQPVLIPGDPEQAAYEERTRNGIPVTDKLAAEVKAVAATSGVPFLFDR